MSLVSEFRAFVNKGNALDLAVGVIVGAAFGKIVNSLVTDIIMPVFATVTGRDAFRNRFLALDGQTYATVEDALAGGGPVVAYGVFINTVVEFFIVAFSIFLVVRQINRWRGTPAQP